MTYEILPLSEWGIVIDEYAKQGMEMPTPELCDVVVAKDDEGEVAGFLVVQLAIHLEPLQVYNPICARGLIRAAEDLLMQRLGVDYTYWCTIDRKSEGYKTVSGIAEAMGIKKTSKDLRAKTIYKLKGDGQ